MSQVFTHRRIVLSIAVPLLLVKLLLSKKKVVSFGTTSKIVKKRMRMRAQAKVSENFHL